MLRMQFGRFLLLVLASFTILSVVHRPSHASPKLTEAQQAKADAALLRLWKTDDTKGKPKVTVGQVRAALGCIRK